jgi:hypothetical protein
MDSQLQEGRKPEKSLLYKFFANPIVQGVFVLIALAVAFSGKLDLNGTIVCIVLGGIIGLFGIWGHISRRVLRVVAMAAYLVAIAIFALYLTAKPREVAANNAEGSKPRQDKTEAAKPPQGATSSQQSAPAPQPPSSANSQTARKQKPKKDRPETVSETKTASEVTKTAAQVQPTYSVTNPIGSIVNQGSTNLGIQTVNNAPSSRLLDDEHAEKFKAALTGVGGTVVIFPDGTDQDVIPLAKQICDLFRDIKSWAMNCVDVPGYPTHMSVSLPSKLIGLHCLYGAGRGEKRI